jgi:4-amino-4-deoxy-L-arabinose transferase-like glycosyltransferase
VELTTSEDRREGWGFSYRKGTGYRERLGLLLQTISSEKFVETRLLPLVLLIVLNVKIWLAFQFPITGWDESIYLLNARRFLMGYDPYVFFELFRPPAVPYLISIIWSATGENYFVAIALQPILTTLAAGVLYLLIKKMFDYKTASVASVLSLIVPTAFEDTNHVLVYGAVLLFITASFYFLWLAIKERPEYYPIAALTLALATLTRYTTVALVGVFIIIVVFNRRKLMSRGSWNAVADFWVWVGVAVFVATWIPWLGWNYVNSGNYDPLASVLNAYVVVRFSEAAAGAPIGPWYSYVVNMPAYIGWPGCILLAVGLVDIRTIKKGRRPILLLWILPFILFLTYSRINDPRYYIEFTPALAVFAALGATKLANLPFFAGRKKILAWGLIALYLVAMFNGSLNLSLQTLQGQEAEAPKLVQLVNWIIAHSNHTDVGATNVIPPYLSYKTNRLFYDVNWIEGESQVLGITSDQYMMKLNVTLIVVTTSYAIDHRLMQQPSFHQYGVVADYVIYRYIPSP